MVFKKLLLSTFLFTGFLSAENSIGIDINSKDVEILASINLNALTDYANGTTYILDLNYLHSDGDNMTRVGFLGQNTLQGVEGLTLSIGLKTVLADDFLAFPIMARGNYVLPLNGSIPTTSLALSLAYAPSILTFLDGEDYTDISLELDMEVISNIHIFTGYRNIKTNYTIIDKTFNNSFYGGIKLSF
ncbi:MAG: hypothetical protein COA92_02470 [Sulfurovum sp.]|nr:MAG: hypothetical protein COA92_02470 [Sulfurovum sp.]